MRILALESTEAIGTVAALEGGEVLKQVELNPHQQSARSLAPGIQEVLEAVGWRASEVELVAVTRGPGSFTGLRVGLSTAKAFAYAVGAPILGIDTLEAIAANAPEGVDWLAVAVDAQRGQVMAGSFRRGPEGWMIAAGPTQLRDVDDWLSSLPPGIQVSGPILRKHALRLPAHLVPLPAELWAPKAALVGVLAARDWGAGRRDDLWSLAPVYSRRSAAEEKWEQQNRGQGKP